MAEPSSSSSSAVAGKSEAEIEETLDRMLTRLALCDDSKLEVLLSRVLPLTISSLSSNSAAVRNKVLEILSHVNKRVKHHAEIGLPLAELWKIYTEANGAPMVKNFCIVYIEMAFDRIHVKEKESMSPILLANISELPQQHQDIILRIVIKVIGECHSIHVDHEIAQKYKLITRSQDRELFIEFCLYTVLYQPQSQGGGCPPGLSITQTARVTGKHPLQNEVLLMRKLGILNVVEAMELSPELVYPLFIASCADRQEGVVKKGEELLKKKASSANLDDPDLIRRLFLLFNGTSLTENVSPEARIIPANHALRARLMSVFCRSITAANSFPSTLQCIFGCVYGAGTTSRLKQLGMEFTVWVFKHAKLEQLKLMGPVILNAILKSLDASSNSEADALSRDTKPFAYQAIGLLARRLPHLFRDKVVMAAQLFEALKLETQSLRLAIQEATNSLAAAYKDAPPTVLRELETLLLKNAQVEESEVRFCAVRWAISLFDMQHCPSRYICMLGAADTRLDIREMALEGLFPGRNEQQPVSENSDLKYPKLKSILDYILDQQPKMLESSEMIGHNLLIPPKTYVAMIKFLLKCFESEMKTDSSERPCEFQVSVEKLCLLLEHAMSFESSFELHAIASKSLIVIGSHIPALVATHYAPKSMWLKNLLGHMDVDTRESAARLLGIASSALPLTESCALINELISSFSGTLNLRFEAKHGALCAIGYITADCMSRMPTFPDTLLQSALQCLINVVNSETATLASFAMQALGHIGLRVPLPPLVDDSGSVDILSMLQGRLSKLFSSDDVKAIQKVVIAIGHICANETSFSKLKTAADFIFSLCRSKVEDILFAAGEAIAFLWGGVPVTADLILKTDYSSLSATSNFLTRDLAFSPSKTDSSKSIEDCENSRIMVRDAITRKLFDDLLYSSRKEERCAGTVWLLSLTMYCGQHPTIQRMLPDIQEAFSHLLGEQNELTQELASQGMSIVYELGDQSMKKNLVNALVGTLTGSGKRKRAVKLVEDSEVFQEGTIGQSPGGGKLSTYKELCSLANEMGQPDLIYKFMDLANYQATLNSKRGAAFGFSKIAKQAGDALQPHLRLLIPRLVRYQYDPDKNVQDAMAHIWKSLITDSKKAIDDHLDLIIDDLLMQCGSRLWRSREASCLALADIIQGRRFAQVGKHLKNLWTVAFRAMDDIKETVRNSGDKLGRAVTSLTIRLCDISLTEKSDASQAMDVVLPFLLSEGILSKVESIRKASIGVVMKLAKGAGTALRPHLPDLVCCMLESLSSLEDQGLNYVELHAANAGIQTEKLESLRISIAKGSPMWDTLNLCIDVLDRDSLSLLIPRLAQLVRTGVGLNTRVGVGGFISLLVQKVGDEIKPFTGTLLRQLFPVVKEERSIAAKRSFAGACAVILKYTSASQAQKFIEDSTALHTGDRNAQISCAVLLKSYSSMAPDIVSGYQAAIVPVVFISRFEDDKVISGLYDELWEEYTSGERMSLQLYLDEIVSLISESISSSSWARKKKSAQATVKLSEVLGESLSSHHDVLLKSLMKELPGRLWEGKEALLYALAVLCKSCHKAISAENPKAPNTILSLVSTACRKKVKKYRDAAYYCLEQVIKAFRNPEFFTTIFPLLFEVCNSATPGKSAVPLAGDAVNAESEETDNASVPREKVLDCLTSCIHVACIDDILEEKKKLTIVVLASLTVGCPWIVKMSAFSLIEELCSRLCDNLNHSRSSIHQEIITLVNELFHSVSPKVLECISTVKIAQVHITASACLLEIMKLYRDLPSEHQTGGAFKGEVFHLYEVEKNEAAKSTLKNCMDIIQNLEH